MLRAVSPVGCLCPLSRDRSQATMEINAFAVDNMAAFVFIKAEQIILPAPFLTHPQAAGSLVHIQAPFVTPGPPFTHTAFHSHEHTHSLTHLHSGDTPSLTQARTDTRFLTHTPLHSRSNLHIHTPHPPRHRPPSFMHSHSHTGSQVSQDKRGLEFRSPSREYVG